MSTATTVPVSSAKPAHRRATTPIITRTGVGWSLVALVLTRLLGLVAMAVALRERAAGGLSFHTLHVAMSTWDGFWYLKAAQHGWPSHLPHVQGQVSQSTIAFFPGLPLAIRAVAALPGVGYFGAALIVEAFFQFTTLLLVGALARELWGEPAARKAVFLVALFPGAFIFSLIYCEPLMITFALACFLALRRRRWLWAGVAAGLATAVTPTAVSLAVVCGVAALVAIVTRREWRALIAPVLAPAGIVAYLGYLWASTGVAHAWNLTERQGWGQQLVLLNFKNAITYVDRGGVHWDLVLIISGTAVTVAMIVVYVLGRPRRREELTGWWLEMGLFSLVVLGLAFFSNILGLRPRFVLSAFPLIMVLAWRAHRVVFGILCVISAGLMMYLLGVVVTSQRIIP